MENLVLKSIYEARSVDWACFLLKKMRFLSIFFNYIGHNGIWQKMRFFSFCYALYDNMRGPKKYFLYEKMCSIERSPSVDNPRYLIFFLTPKIEKVMTVWKKMRFFFIFSADHRFWGTNFPNRHLIQVKNVVFFCPKMIPPL